MLVRHRCLEVRVPAVLNVAIAAAVEVGGDVDPLVTIYLDEMQEQIVFLCAPGSVLELRHQIRSVPLATLARGAPNHTAGHGQPVVLAVDSDELLQELVLLERERNAAPLLRAVGLFHRPK